MAKVPKTSSGVNPNGRKPTSRTHFPHADLGFAPCAGFANSP